MKRIINNNKLKICYREIESRKVVECILTKIEKTVECRLKLKSKKRNNNIIHIILICI